MKEGEHKSRYLRLRSKPKGCESQLEAEVESNDTKVHTFRSATIHVLRQAKKPMGSLEIYESITKQGLLHSNGRTPQNTIAAMIYSDIKKNNSASEFIRMKEGFGLRCLEKIYTNKRTNDKSLSGTQLLPRSRKMRSKINEIDSKNENYNTDSFLGESSVQNRKRKRISIQHTHNDDKNISTQTSTRKESIIKLENDGSVPGIDRQCRCNGTQDILHCNHEEENTLEKSAGTQKILGTRSTSLNLLKLAPNSKPNVIHSRSITPSSPGVLLDSNSEIFASDQDSMPLNFEDFPKSPAMMSQYNTLTFDCFSLENGIKKNLNAKPLRKSPSFKSDMDPNYEQSYFEGRIDFDLPNTTHDYDTNIYGNEKDHKIYSLNSLQTDEYCVSKWNIHNDSFDGRETPEQTSTDLHWNMEELFDTYKDRRMLKLEKSHTKNQSLSFEDQKSKRRRMEPSFNEFNSINEYIRTPSKETSSEDAKRIHIPKKQNLSHFQLSILKKLHIDNYNHNIALLCPPTLELLPNEEVYFMNETSGVRLVSYENGTKSIMFTNDFQEKRSYAYSGWMDTLEKNNAIDETLVLLMDNTSKNDRNNFDKSQVNKKLRARNTSRKISSDHGKRSNKTGDNIDIPYSIIGKCMEKQEVYMSGLVGHTCDEKGTVVYGIVQYHDLHIPIIQTIRSVKRGEFCTTNFGWTFEEDGVFTTCECDSKQCGGFVEQNLTKTVFQLGTHIKRIMLDEATSSLPIFTVGNDPGIHAHSDSSPKQHQLPQPELYLQYIFHHLRNTSYCHSQILLALYHIFYVNTICEDKLQPYMQRLMEYSQINFLSRIHPKYILGFKRFIQLWFQLNNECCQHRREIISLDLSSIPQSLIHSYSELEPLQVMRQMIIFCDWVSEENWPKFMKQCIKVLKQNISDANHVDDIMNQDCEY